MSPVSAVDGFVINSDTVTQSVIDRLRTNQDVTGLAEVYYGDPGAIPVYPAAVVEPMPKTRDLVGTHRFEINFLTVITIIAGRVDDPNIIRKEVQQQAEVVEKVLMDDPYYNNTLIFSYVTRLEPGQLLRSDVMHRAVRLLWTAQSREEF